GDCTRAIRLSTRVVPTYEVPRTTPPTVADWPKLGGLVVDMMELGESSTAELDRKLHPLVTAYEAWIKEREVELKQPDLVMYQRPAKSSIEHCKNALQRIEAGLKLLQTNEDAARAFRFANQAMWQQRIHTIISLKKRRDEPVEEKAIDVPGNRS